MRQPRDEESWQSEAAEEAEEGASAAAEPVSPAASGLPGGGALGSVAVHKAACGASKQLPTMGEAGPAETAIGITDSLLPPPALAAAGDAEQPGSPAIAAMHSAGAAQPPSQQQQQPGAGSPLKVALRGSPGRKGSPGASLSPAGSRQQQQQQQQQLCASSPSALWGSSGGAGAGCAGSPKRAPAVLTSHLTKELVSLQDELLVKTDLADALASKVRRSCRG